MQSLKRMTPWWAKIGLKIVFSRLPVTHQLWNKLGVFCHGPMDDPQYVIDVFDSHFDACKSDLPQSFVALELGPGRSVGSALVAKSRGASTVYLVDVGDFTGTGIDAYNRLAKTLGTEHRFQSIEDVLAFSNARYMTDGLQSLRELPDQSVDFVFSQAVLEHVALAEFDETIRQLYRVQRAGGVCSHEIDLRDHLHNSLNSLRFSRKVWEANWMSRSGFYTNRLRASQILASFTAAGYEILDVQQNKWQQIPLDRKKFDTEFAEMSEDDLLTSTMRIRAQKPLSVV